MRNAQAGDRAQSVVDLSCSVMVGVSEDLFVHDILRHCLSDLLAREVLMDSSRLFRSHIFFDRRCTSGS